MVSLRPFCAPSRTRNSKSTRSSLHRHAPLFIVIIDGLLCRCPCAPWHKTKCYINTPAVATVMRAVHDSKFLKPAAGWSLRQPSQTRESRQTSILLLDLFPKPTAIRNVWENQLSLVERERARVLIFAKRKREHFTFHAPATADGFTAAVGPDDPILGGTVSMKHEVFVSRALENDGCFPPVTN
jgi:hypothetical protein